MVLIVAALLAGLLALPTLLVALRVLTALLAGLLALSALLVALRIVAGLLIGLLLIAVAVLVLLGTHKVLLGCHVVFRRHPSNGNVPMGAGFLDGPAEIGLRTAPPCR
jgi:hypothetical protein